MPVAKTYQQMEIQGEPFEENGRMYVYVGAAKGTKKVRWYTETEYRRMYPNEEPRSELMNFNARHAFGFGELGYITLYKGSAAQIEQLVLKQRSLFRSNLTFGYYTPSHLPLPTLPDSITPIKLTWAEVMDYDTRMKSHEIVAKYVNGLLAINQNSASKYQGTKDEWIEKTVTIKENTASKSHFGEEHTHVMRDAEGNTYIWKTGSKNIAVDVEVHLKMKVKEHKEINGEQCTVVWYCKS